MNWSRFYYDFAAAYGTCWIFVMVMAVLTQSHVNAGAFGMIGFPLLSAGYAMYRKDVAQPGDEKMEELQKRIARLETENASESGQNSSE